MQKKQEFLDILLKINKKPKISQRNLSKELGISLGKLNYCLKSLKEKGLVKVDNFMTNDHKYKYFYILTPKGITEKTKLTINFMKVKLKEYDKLKKELERDNK